jgi:succinoglycan biosynthesis protein ExoM
MTTFDQSRSNAAPRVAVCIATYKRPEMLRQSLRGLAALSFEKVPPPDVTVFVVDNDVSASAERICSEAQLPFPVKYVTETRRGIAQARNRAIQEAEAADFVAFIDDDEIPTPSWLDELLATQAEFSADVVCGPVRPHFAYGVPEWVKAGRFFHRPIYVSGQNLDWCSTNNVLIRKSVFAAVKTFDERFALTGGEDTQFFLRVRQAGYSIVASSAACVDETVSISRANLSWVLRRAYQSGNSWVLCESSLDRRISTRIVRAMKACGWIVFGLASACVSVFFGMAALARSLWKFCLGAGMLSALVGQSYQAYQSSGAEVAQ